MTDEQAKNAVDDLLAFPITVFPTAPLLGRMWQLRYDIGAYDGCFIALAEAIGLPPEEPAQVVAVRLEGAASVAGSGGSLHFLADPLEFEALRQDRRFRLSPHHGDRGWLALELGDVGSIDWIEVAELLESAYLQVAPQGLAQDR